MIETIKIYELNAFNNAFKVVSLLKNCVRQISKNKSFKTKSPVFISVRWCKDKNMFVGDSGTSLNRDKSGITIEQINSSSIKIGQEVAYYYKSLLIFCNESDCFNDFCKMHKIISNKFKCIVFNVDFDNDFLLPVGIFSFVKSKSREGIDSVKNKKLTAINISHDINKKIASFNSDLFKIDHLLKIDKKISVDHYYNELLKQEVNNSFIYKNFNLNKEKFKDSYYNLKSDKRELYKHYFFVQDLVNSIFKDNFLNLDIIIVYDDNLQKFIKLKKINYNHVESIQENYKNYLPVLL